MEDRYIVDEAYIAREYEIPTSRVGLMEDKLAKLNRKADKLGCPRGVAEVISEPFIKEVHLSDNPYARPTKIEFVRVAVTGEAPKLSGWTFHGYIDQDKLVYGEHITDEERERQGECDYCNQSRPRTHTYVVSHESGERKVVGSTCMKDFLGGLDPKSMVSWLTIFRKFVASFTDEEYRDDGSSEVYGLPNALHLTWQVIRIHGWLSGSEAWNSGGMSTSQVVKELLDASDEAKILFEAEWFMAKDAQNLSDSDPQLIGDAIEWAKSHKDSDNNYLNNISIIAENGYTTKRSMGMAVSILSSYEREVEKRIKAEARRKASGESNHVGEIGKREVFDNVQLTGVQYLDSMFGTSVLHRFLMDDTNQVVWFGSKELDVTVGDTFSIKATVKKHGEFNTVPQTTINRVVKV